MTPSKVKHDALDTMWRFLQMGGQRANVSALKGYCQMLQQAMLQKTAGQRDGRKSDIDFGEIDAIVNAVVIEAMALWLSGALDQIQTDKEE